MGSGYSLIEHIAKGVRFSRWRNTIALMISVYIDTAGSGSSNKDHAMTMGAVVGTVKQWIRFESSWKKFLERYGVNRLHMTDFASSQADFKKWNGQEHTAIRKRFIDRAVLCAKKHSMGGFTATVMSYDDVNAIYEIRENLGSPLAVCGTGIIEQVSTWARQHGVNEREILYFMEDGDTDKGDFITRARRDSFEVQPIAKSKSFVFDICDMIAWKRNAVMKDAYRGKGTFEDGTRSLQIIHPLIVSEMTADRDSLIAHAKQHGYRRRNALP